MKCKPVAVIMSLYKNDRLDYVKLSIESILNQTYKDFDLYLQYDGPFTADIDTFKLYSRCKNAYSKERRE